MKLPCEECKGQCCTYPAMKLREFKKIRKRYGVPKNTEIKNLNGAVMPLKTGTAWCTYLVEGKCSVYDLRPMVCKLYGEHPKLPCQYLYPTAAAKSLLAMAEDIEARGKRILSTII